MSSLSNALASCARQSAIEQRARLLEAVWDDVRDEARSALLAMVPRRLLPRFSYRSGCLDDYTVDLGYMADGSWRVFRDRAGPHPGAALLEAPLLAVFLPCLCRVLLGQSLLLRSIPVWWLGDPATLAMLAAYPARFSLRNGLDPEDAPVTLAGLSAPCRIELQSHINDHPQRFVATLAYAEVLQYRNIIRRPSSAFPM